MDTTAAALRTLDAIGQHTADLTWIEVRLRNELPAILSRLYEKQPPNVCPLADIGEYFVRVLQILAHFAHATAHGNFIHEESALRLGTLLDGDDDNLAATYFDSMHETLKYEYK